MSTLRGRGASQSPQSERPDPYQQVTELILRHLENGTAPWRCPWNRDIGRPRNFSTGKAYRGANVFLLGCRQFETSGSPWWMTFRQASERGGHVRKGERGSLVLKYGTLTPKETAEPNRDDRAKKRPGYLRTFTVFNATQIDGIQFPAAVDSSPKLTQEQRIKRAEFIVEAMPLRPSIREGRSGHACYRPGTDEVEMPSFSSFISPESYYDTLFHELGHATGHSSRLNRSSLTTHEEFGGAVYSLEELVAEMTAAFVGMEAEIVNDGHEQSAAYLSGWLEALKAKEHRRWIVQAAAHASRAADFILGKVAEDAESQPNGSMIRPSELIKGSLEPPPKFPLGRLVGTPAALATLSPEDIGLALQRHQQGDWGNLGDYDVAENERSLLHGLRLFSAYSASDGTRFWIITEHDRSVTTILLPSDY